MAAAGIFRWSSICNATSVTRYPFEACAGSVPELIDLYLIMAFFSTVVASQRRLNEPS